MLHLVILITGLFKPCHHARIHIFSAFESITTLICLSTHPDNKHLLSAFRLILGNVGNHQLQQRYSRQIEGNWVYQESKLQHFITKSLRSALNITNRFYPTPSEQNFLWQDESGFHAVGRPVSGHNFMVKKPEQQQRFAELSPAVFYGSVCGCVWLSLKGYRSHVAVII